MPQVGQRGDSIRKSCLLGLILRYAGGLSVWRTKQLKRLGAFVGPCWGAVVESRYVGHATRSMGRRVKGSSAPGTPSGLLDPWSPLGMRTHVLGLLMWPRAPQAACRPLVVACELLLRPPGVL